MGFLIDMIDVGQGDAFLLTLAMLGPDITVLVDAGNTSAGGTVADFVWKYAKGTLDAIICTHLDNDHMGGMEEVVRRCVVRAFCMNLPDHPDVVLNTLKRQRYLESKKLSREWEILEKSLEAVPDLLTTLRNNGLTPRAITAGMGWNWGDISLRVLSPDTQKLQAAWEELQGEESALTSTLRELYKRFGLEPAPETTAHNNASVVLDVVYQGVPYALLPSDVGADVLREVTRNQSYRFLKVPHHGSKTGLDEALVKQIKPTTAYISVGENSYGHPAPEVLEMLKKIGTKTYCSQRTESCHRGCPSGGFGNMCHKRDREAHPDYSSVDSSKCVNNQ